MSKLTVVDKLPEAFGELPENFISCPAMLKSDNRIYWFDSGHWVCDKSVDELATELVERSEAEA